MRPPGIALLLVWSAVAVACGAMLTARLRSPRAGGVATLADLFCSLLPGAALTLAWMLFVGEVHPTRQCNTPGGRLPWSVWNDAWPVLFLGLPLSGLACLLLGLSGARWARAYGAAQAALVRPLLFGLHVLAWYVVAENGPSV